MRLSLFRAYMLPLTVSELMEYLLLHSVQKVDVGNEFGASLERLPVIVQLEPLLRLGTLASTSVGRRARYSSSSVSSKVVSKVVEATVEEEGQGDLDQVLIGTGDKPMDVGVWDPRSCRRRWSW
jgi:hypothetical protein